MEWPNNFNDIFNNAFNQPFFRQNNPLFNNFSGNNNPFEPNNWTQSNNNNNGNVNSNYNININNTMNMNNNPNNRSNSTNFTNNNPNNYSNNHFFSKSKTQFKEEDPPGLHKKKSSHKNFNLNENSGFYWKNIGNELFNEGKYEKSLEAYDKAIKINDTESVFFTNRARCHKKLKNLKNSLQDSIHAIELDDKNIKAYLICGQCLAEIGKSDNKLNGIQNAINKMTKGS